MPEHWLQLNGAPIIQTRHFLDAQEVLDDAAAVGGIATLIGEAGLGKSFAVEHWLEETPIRTWQFTPRGMTTGRALLAQLLQLVTQTDEQPHGTEFTLLPRLLHELAYEDAVIVFDEAQWLKRAMKTLRALWLHRRKPLGLVFVGGPEFEALLASESMLHSRLAGGVRFQPLTERDLGEILPHYHPIYLEANPQLFRRVNRRYANGSFRLWANFTRLAAKQCRRDGLETLTAEASEEVLRRLL
jgi:DNA transposition AAA+ family ATPase